MLVLSRKTGQKLMIGDEIEVVVQRVTGNRVTIGIVAPAHVPIVRGELTIELTEKESKKTPENGPDQPVAMRLPAATWLGYSVTG